MFPFERKKHEDWRIGGLRAKIVLILDSGFRNIGQRKFHF